MGSSSSPVLASIAGDVEGDVADAEDGDLLGLQRPGARDVGVAVVPGDEVGGAVGAVEVDAGDVEGAVGVGAGGEDDGVVEVAQVVEVDVGAVVDVAEEPDLRRLSSTWCRAMMMPLMRGWSGATP